MIKIKQIESSGFKKVDFESANYELLVDGEQLPKVQVSGSKSGFKEIGFEIYTRDIYSGEKLLSQKLADFPKIVYFSVPVKFELLDFETFITIYQEADSSKLPEINFYFDAKLLLWNQVYSFSEFEENLFTVIAENTDDKIEIKIYNSHDETKFVIGTHQGFGNLTLIEELSPFIEKSRQVYLKAKQKTIQGKSIKTVTGYFDFPENLKVPCEQYLLYFAQFLQDLGIHATSNLKEEAGKVLFSVTPTDDIEALDKIREALAVYLNLPASPILYDDSFAAMRLQQQIENLQHSQRMAVRELQFNEKLLIAQSDTIREKNITISQQQSVLEQQNKVIEKIQSKSIMMDSVENKEELEEIYDGLKIGESKFLKEQLGIHLNPAKVIKTVVKNTFGKDEKKSVLGLDEES